ncbi:MAG TPA: hypothetical protein VK427_26805 [Kofleriaceae bacterium]|nr:hypothetical protein [Kofleriaceae bacterium]
MKLSLVLLTASTLAACGSDDIDSDEEARRAYFGLDASIEKSLALGFAGFNASSSANIVPQMMTGDGAGMLTITGQVDQGSSDNKGMRLRVGMVSYTDGAVTIAQEGEDDVTVDITYNTHVDPTMQPSLELSLKNIPTGTFTGTLTGIYTMTGDIDADAELNLSFSGSLQSSGSGATNRVPGGTTVTGTAKSGDGVYNVDVKL